MCVTEIDVKYMCIVQAEGEREREREREKKRESVCVTEIDVKYMYIVQAEGERDPAYLRPGSHRIPCKYCLCIFTCRSTTQWLFKFKQLSLWSSTLYVPV